jgi:uncharacterized protein (TIGR02147 family)
MVKMKKKPSVFAYNDFRNFLQDMFDFRHGQDKTFSKARVCKSLGLPNSRSYFRDVLMGKHISSIKIPLFINVFGLSEKEAQFFRVLVNYNQALNDPQERDLLFEQLVSLHQTPRLIISSKDYGYYKEWYHSVVRAILNISEFKKSGNYLDLARKVFPPLTESQARSSVALLLELGLIKETKEGLLKPTVKVITTGKYAKDEIIKQYQLKSLEIARQAILKNRSLPQRVITKMITVSEEGLNQILNQVEKFDSEVTTIVHKDVNAADRVYQLDIVLFPHSLETNT